MRYVSASLSSMQKLMMAINILSQTTRCPLLFYFARFALSFDGTLLKSLPECQCANY